MADDFLSALGVADPSEPDLKALVAAKAKQYGIDPDLFGRLVTQESAYDPTATSDAGAVGLAQLMPDTAKQYGVTDAKDPEQNLDAGAHYLSDLLKAHKGDMAAALTEYGGFRAKDPAAYIAAVTGAPAKPAPDDFLGALGVDAAKVDASPEAVWAGAGITPYKGSEDTLSKAQQKTYETLVKGRAKDEGAPAGSEGNPYWEGPTGSAKDAPAGSYFVDAGGKLQRAPGGERPSSSGAGLGQGVADIATTLANVLPGTGDSDVANALRAQQMKYGATYGGDFRSGLGRFTGQVLGSAPLIGGAETALAPVARVLGPTGTFLAGEGGKTLPPGIIRFLARTGSLAAHGAQQGAAATGLTASASDRPALQQMAEGALGGAVLGPVLPAVQGAGRWLGTSIRDLIQPLTTEGRDQIASRIIGNFGREGPTVANNAEIVPGSTPTLAQATGNPGIATLERTARLSRPTPFAQRSAENNAARLDALTAARGDEHTVADLASQRQAVLDGARTRAFGAVQPTNPQPVVDTIDAALASPEAHMEAVTRPLQALRDKIVQPPPDMTPEESAAFNRKVAQTFGADGEALTPEVMQGARDKLGAKFEEIAGNTQVPWDDPLRTSIGQIIHDTAQVVPEAQLPPLFKQLANIADTGGKEGAPGVISGASYQALTKKGAPLSSLQNAGDPTIRDAANRIRDVLDDALERSLGASNEGPAGVPAGQAAGTDSAQAADGAAADGKGGPTDNPNWRDSRPLPEDLWDDPEALKLQAQQAKAIDTAKAKPIGSPERDKALDRDAELTSQIMDRLDAFRAERIEQAAAPPAARPPVASDTPQGPSPLDELRATRLQYKNLKTAEAALRSAGPDRAVTPRALYNAVKQNFGSYAYKGGGPLGDVAEAAVKAQESRPPVVENDPRQLYGMRESLSGAIDKLESDGSDASHLAASRLKAVRDSLDASIEQGASGYGDFRALAERSAEPIEAQKYLQSLRLTDSKGNITLAQVNNAMERIKAARAKPGKSPAKSVSEATLAQLEALRQDLLRESNVNLGRPLGSDTAQHLVTGQIAGNMGVPLALGATLGHHPLVGAALGAGKLFYGMKNEQVLDQLATRLLNPEMPRPTIARRPANRPLSRLGAPLLPVTGGLLTSRLLGSQ